MTGSKMLVAALTASTFLALPALAQTIGSDRDACNKSEGPAIQANITGLKDRTGRLKLELYPATEEDFLKDDHDLRAENKVFRRVWASMPDEGPVSMCIKVPEPGTYALFFTHDRDHRNKFNFWKDGAGVPGNGKLGRSKPDLSQAIVKVGSGVTVVNIRVQYLRGLGGFGPID
ncbi:DUF2141 domain-containing protein [Stakelama pacifica]|uniref:Putative secreted protein with PEP-CTERM sorting signal n=1 Tax=Stakelama pacifica TaxID=517720 RepID=A0A4V3BT25_9SPHN|nr:putative secreted protein with PEP-CTERM sorting signal [Stakelama pacifica]GGO96181.1 hypothetical protein GCM10011329_22100 [Stakelama pacifica]